MEIFRVHQHTKPQVPVIISVPHCGTGIPQDMVDQYVPSLLKTLDDTDWFVDRLYSFAPGLGITMITSNISRWIIDLNRDPESKPLYSDGRIITALCPATDFLGRSIYIDGRKSVAGEEVARRTRLYFDPYHHMLHSLLSETRDKFGKVLLWDCHSIRQSVPTIQKEKFPDLILGSADERSAAPELTSAAVTNLDRPPFRFSHNRPFKGGYITRHYGRPAQGLHALQLEMTKINYMDDNEVVYESGRAERMQAVLKRTLEDLAQTIIA